MMHLTRSRCAVVAVVCLLLASPPGRALAQDPVVAVANTPAKLTSTDMKERAIAGPGAAGAFAQVGNKIDPTEQVTKNFERGFANDLIDPMNPHTDRIGPMGMMVPVIPKKDVVESIGKARNTTFNSNLLTDIQAGRRLMYKRIFTSDKVAAAQISGGLLVASKDATVEGNPYTAYGQGAFALQLTPASRIEKGAAVAGAIITGTKKPNAPAAFATAFGNDPITFEMDSPADTGTFTFTLGDASEGNFFRLEANEPDSFASAWIELDSTIPGQENLLTVFMTVLYGMADVEEVIIEILDINEAEVGMNALQYDAYLRDNLAFGALGLGVNMALNSLGEVPLLNLNIPAGVAPFDLTLNVGGLAGVIPEPATLTLLLAAATLLTRRQR